MKIGIKKYIKITNFIIIDKIFLKIFYLISSSVEKYTSLLSRNNNFILNLKILSK